MKKLWIYFICTGMAFILIAVSACSYGEKCYLNGEAMTCRDYDRRVETERKAFEKKMVNFRKVNIKPNKTP